MNSSYSKSRPEFELPSYNRATAPSAPPSYDSDLQNIYGSRITLPDEAAVSISSQRDQPKGEFTLEKPPLEPPPPYYSFRESPRSQLVTQQPGYLPHLQPTTPQVITIPYADRAEAVSVYT